MNVHEFLKDRGADFEFIMHRPTYDAQRLAQAVAERGHHVAKTVLLHSDVGNALVVLPATHSVDLNKARRILKADQVSLATEQEVGEQFPDCEIGAIPPFGSPYGIPTLVDESFLMEEDIVFQGNKHDEAFRMKLTEFLELEGTATIDISHGAPF